MRGFVFTALLLPSFAAVFCQAPPVVQNLPNGLEARQGARLLSITALTDHILRVRESNNGSLPEDASWSVLSLARAAHVSVVPEQNGFHTSQIRITVGPELLITLTDMEGHLLQKDAEPIRWSGNRFRIYKHKEPDDHFFGLGDKPGPLDRAGQSYVMWNTDSFGWQESTDPLYKSIPYFLEFRGGRALGVLFDNTWRTFFDFGHELPDEYSFGAPDGPVDYYLMYGPDPKEVEKDYAWLTGPTPLPPLWALGFQQSRYSYETEDKLMDVAKRLRADHIPADALYLDIDYQRKYRPFTVDEAAFPLFPEMVKKLSDEHFHLVLITDLHIAELPGSNYAPYDSGIAGDHFVKNPDGSTYVGPVWPGAAVFPEFTQKESRAWWGALYKQFVAEHISGFWNDMNEPAVFTYPSKTMPDATRHRIDEPGFQKRTASHLEIHNVCGMENSRATYEGVLQLNPRERPFILTRASYAGGQHYAATWTGDNSSTWNHLRETTPQLLNLGISGFALAGADVGGFAGSPSAELLTKWLEVAAFQPIDRDHAAKGTRAHEPWVDGPGQESIRRRFIEERYRLMPYLYTTVEETSRTGLPIVRPLFLEFPHATDDGHPMDLDASGEFMFGADLLVAPNPSPEEIAPYEVHLPPGVWYDYWTGERFEHRSAISGEDSEKRDELLLRKRLMVTPTLSELPVYARGGSVIPVAPPTESTEVAPIGPLVLRIYLDDARGKTGDQNEICSGDIYQDDGHTFAFKNGDFLRLHVSCTANQDGSVKVVIGKHQGSYTPWWSAFRLEVYGLDRLVSASGSQTSQAPVLIQQVNDNPEGLQVVLR
jgi:alpha-glucosidase